jgi:nicotinate-nucleotide adenylyltransferase
LIAISNFALFGGTFDPIHRGHLYLISTIVEKTIITSRTFDELLVIPSGEPWMREAPVASKADRLEMVELAISELPDEISEHVRVSDIEIARTGPTYAIDTVLDLQGELDGKWTMIIGSDVLESLPQWRSFDELARLVDFLVVKRPGSTVNEIPKARMTTIDIDALDISATELRQALADGADVDEFISPLVMGYIEEKGLYARA